MDYGALGGDREAAAIGDILAQAFAFPVADAVPWIDKSGREHVRVLREGRRPIACLLLVPMGQWFGGRSVRMVGIAAVGVAPHRRGRGAAAELMTQALLELHREGCALSSLYPATQVLYRKVGYEHAGGRHRVEVPAAALPLRDGASRGRTEVHPLEPRDEEAVVRVYRDVASRTSGYLDRGPYVWGRVRQPRGEPVFAFGVGTRGDLEGYVYLQQKRSSTGRYDLALSDFAASTPRACRRLFSFLGEHRSMADNVVWYGGPTPPELMLLAEQSYKVHLDLHWMLRIVHLRRALTERGYPVGVTAELHLAVRDEVVRGNAGRWVLTVAGGRGRVRRGGRGRLSLHVRALASLYSGYLSAAALRSLGLLEGDDADVAAAAAVFTSPAPGMADMF